MQIYNKLQIACLMLVIYFNGFFLFTGISRSDTIHVNRWSEESPYKTVSEGIEAAQPGDVLSILGTYYYPERLVISKRLTIAANGGTVTIGECKQVARPGDLIKPEDADTVVSDSLGLRRALKKAESMKGYVIYIRDNAVIRLTGAKWIQIPSGTTLASGRGNVLKKGALLYSNHKTDLGWDLFNIVGSNVRITGIRFRGPTTDVVEERIARCIRLQVIDNSSYVNIEIDHNEFFGWPIAAVTIEKNRIDRCSLSSVHIHDNYIHHNLCDELGYGVSINSTYALIEKNVFDQNRHAISADGSPNTGYEARWNVVLDKNDASEQSFDMHCNGGQDEDCGSNDFAGEYMMIQENTFLYKDDPSVEIRSKPSEGAFIINNTFSDSRSPGLLGWKMAVKQKNNFGNLVERNNRYEENHQHELAFGDFDGDGATDVFWADGRNWWFSRRGTIVWTHLNSSNITLEKLAFGDFDGNDTTDVFYIESGKWYISWGGTSNWAEINAYNISLNDVAFGDFDGDGKTDVIRKHKQRPIQWEVSYGGTQPWEKLDKNCSVGGALGGRTSNIGVKDVAFRDFNGDGKTDIFMPAGNKWMVWLNGTCRSRELNHSRIPLSDLAFGDFDGDKKTDVVRVNNLGKLQISYGGTDRWKQLNDLNLYKEFLSLNPLDRLYFGDFDGNDTTDIFMIKEKSIPRKKTTDWWISRGRKSGWRQLNPDFDGTIE